MSDERLEVLGKIIFDMGLRDQPGEIEDRDKFPEPLAESEAHNLRARQEIGPS